MEADGHEEKREEAVAEGSNEGRRQIEGEDEGGAHREEIRSGQGKDTLGMDYAGVDCEGEKDRKLAG